MAAKKKKKKTDSETKKLRWVKFQISEDNYKYLEEVAAGIKANQDDLPDDWTIGDLYHEAMCRSIHALKVLAAKREDLRPARVQMTIYTAIVGQANDVRELGPLMGALSSAFPFHRGTINFGLCGLPGNPRGGSKAKELKRWWKDYDSGFKTMEREAREGEAEG